jgi:A/G-specific adenine glycosylase
MRIDHGGHSVDATAFRRKLIAWGHRHFRPFPWRFTQDPYHILLAEIMLHRTRAAQVAPVFQRFITRYPDTRALTTASRAELRQELYSLGLQWRIDLVAEMATHLVERFDGTVPELRDDLISLPGVSDYIASAVRCFAWGHPEPLIDTNTVRVVGRLFGLEITESSRRNRTFKNLISSLVDLEQPREYNFALLDLADAICTKRTIPGCSQCPVAQMCASAGCWN